MKIFYTFSRTFSIILFALLTSICQAQWSQVGQDISGVQDNDLVGYAVQISDDGQVIAVGAPVQGLATNLGELRIYENQNETWVLKGESIVSGADHSHFGHFIAMSGDGNTVAAASYNDNLSVTSWRVEVYHYESGNWQQWGDYLVEDTVSNSFGWSLKLSYDGRTLAVGAQGRGAFPNLTQGYAKVFTFEDNAWVQKGQAVKGTDPGSDFFGRTVSITRDGSFLAVGAPQDSETGINKGKIFVYKFEDGSWIQQGESIKGSFNNQGVGTNISMSDDGQKVASSNPGVHAPLANGLAQVFELQPTQYWTQVGTNIIGGDQDLLGASISLSGDGNTFATGSIYYSEAFEQGGAVRVFRYEDSDWQQWGETILGEYMGGQFGLSVALNADGNTFVAGAPHTSIKTSSAGLVQVYQFGNPTSVEEGEEPIAMNIYPNPSQGVVTLELETLPEKASVSIVDLTGKNVYTAPILKSESLLDLSGLSKGLYVMRIATNKSVQIRKLVLNQ